MPYKSLKQEGYFHTHEGTGRGQIKPAVVKEFDAATKGKSLPKQAPKPVKKSRKR